MPDSFFQAENSFGSSRSWVILSDRKASSPAVVSLGKFGTLHIDIRGPTLCVAGRISIWLGIKVDLVPDAEEVVQALFRLKQGLVKVINRKGRQNIYCPDRII